MFTHPCIIAWLLPASILSILSSGCATSSPATISSASQQAILPQYGQGLVWAPAPTDPSTAKLPLAPRYSTSQVHYVSDSFSSGAFLILDDNTVWQIDESHTPITANWLVRTEILVVEKPYNQYIFHELFKLDSGESVRANYVGTTALQTYIQGKFEGWNGNSEFKLFNGQMVKQADYKTIYYYAYTPKVLFVNSGVPGLYEMIVDGVQDKIGVYVLRQ